MTCPIHVGDTFVWKVNYKGARIGDTAEVTDIYVDEDGVAQVTVVNYRGIEELVTAEDIHERVEEGRLGRNIEMDAEEACARAEIEAERKLDRQRERYFDRNGHF